MPTRFRVASFNVENLFERARLLNFDDNAQADPLLARVEELRQELKRKTYDKEKILKLYHELKEWIEIAEVRGKLFDRNKTQVKADGVDDWGGFIDFKKERFTEEARANTARVIRTVNADICCLVEVESRPVLKHFCIDRLPKKGTFKDYRHLMLIDGNDPRGIDVALASRFPLLTLRSHVDDRSGNSSIFSRDCLEIEVDTPVGAVWILLNHFKSKGYGAQATSDAKRKRQAERVAEILQTNFDLRKDRVIVVGDLNDTPDSKPLKPLLGVKHLHDVLALTFSDAADRWTYHYKKNEQIDFMLVSEPLRAALKDAGVERRGIFGVDKFTNGQVQAFDTVKRPKDAASDHGAVWADFEL
ncbi:MAG TPA: endonuclease/exonuclease/phosphatase family protein [Longimicrobium sp.]|jgi:endonuclease/exonuclease/phosphatase family metal-dependent hydrolase